MISQVSFSFDLKGKRILAIYFKVSNEKIARTVEVAPDCYLDLDKNDGVVGAELITPKAIVRLREVKKAAREYDAPELAQMTELAAGAMTAHMQ